VVVCISTIQERVLKLIQNVDFECSNQFIAQTLGITVIQAKSATYTLYKKGELARFFDSGCNWYFPRKRGELKLGTKAPFLVHYLQLNQKKLLRRPSQVPYPYPHTPVSTISKKEDQSKLIAQRYPLKNGYGKEKWISLPTSFVKLRWDENPEHFLKIQYGKESVDVRIHADNAPIGGDDILWAIKFAEGHLQNYYMGVNLLKESLVVDWHVGPPDRPMRYRETAPARSAYYFDKWFFQVYKRRVEGFKKERVEFVSKQPTSLSNVLGILKGVTATDQIIQMIPVLFTKVEELTKGMIERDLLLAKITELLERIFGAIPTEPTVEPEEPEEVKKDRMDYV